MYNLEFQTFTTTPTAKLEFVAIVISHFFFYLSRTFEIFLSMTYVHRYVHPQIGKTKFKILISTLEKRGNFFLFFENLL